MTISPGFTTSDVRQLVFGYEQQPYGTKAAWLADRGHTRSRMKRRRQSVFSGDLDQGLIPRESGGTTPRKRREIIEQSVDQLQDAHDAELEQLNARILVLEGTNDALGMAIGLLHAMREEEPDGLASTTEPTGS